GGNVTINGVDLLVPDYVFDTNYQLLSPIDLEEFTKIHHHLPNVASADEIKASGLNLSQFILQLLQQVENNVLYILDLNKRLTVIEQKEALVLASPSPSLVASINEPNLTAIIKDKINDLTQKYADQMATGAAGPLATNSAVLAASEPASPSAYLDIDSVNANAGFFKDYLAVIGQTTVTSLKVNNLLSVDSISSLSGRLNLLAGLMTLDDSGNVIIKGNLNVTGAIVASQINTPQDAALQMNIASASALIIYNDIGEPLATFSGQSAQFNQLSLNNSGSATVSAGENNVVVASDKLTPNSQIIVTFNSNYTPASKYWVIKDVAKKEFTVFTNYPVNNDSPIDWLIIN
ncbi:MAG: hypothetical protein NTZ93_01880, partial [Candidatus Beckwithbacteria bacterium]|nr:hypothetical protein [Candidatus Beckwithbacteria bacterium]